MTTTTTTLRPSATERDSIREFMPGTLGWTADDLDDPQFQDLWERGRYEIIEGVLTEMSPPFFDGQSSLQQLTFILQKHLESKNQSGRFAGETGFILSRRRVVGPDMVFMTPQDLERQREANARRSKPKAKYGWLLVPPTLIIESVSLGHEAHDRETKRRWYAEFGVPHYWMLDGQLRTLDCLLLDGKEYRIDQSGRNDDELRPSLFPGLVIPLSTLWA